MKVIIIVYLYVNVEDSVIKILDNNRLTMSSPLSKRVHVKYTFSLVVLGIGKVWSRVP